MKHLFLLIILAGVSFPAYAAQSVEGLWLTQNERSVIEVSKCNLGLCGYVYWIIDGGMQTDAKNPDESLRGEPMCGLPIMWGLKQDGEQSWENGKIYKADEGDTYDADIELLSDGTLKVRGYMGMSLFGKTQIWKRIEASDYPRCKLS